jgi:hypothetical protein
VKFPTPPEPEKVKSETPKPLKSLTKYTAKVVTVKEREDKAEQAASLSPENGEDRDEWLTHDEAVKFGLTPGSRLYRLATGELQPEE